MTHVVQSASVGSAGSFHSVTIKPKTRSDKLKLNVEYKTIGEDFVGKITQSDGKYILIADLDKVNSNFYGFGYRSRHTFFFNSLSAAQKILWILSRTPRIVRVVSTNLRQAPSSYKDFQEDILYVKEDKENEPCHIVQLSRSCVRDPDYTVFMGVREKRDELSSCYVYPCLLAKSKQEAQQKAYSWLVAQRPGAVRLPSNNIAVPEKKGGWGCSVS